MHQLVHERQDGKTQAWGITTCPKGQVMGSGCCFPLRWLGSGGGGGLGLLLKTQGVPRVMGSYPNSTGVKFKASYWSNGIAAT